MRTSDLRAATAAVALCSLLASSAAPGEKTGKPSATKVAAEVDRLLDAAISKSGGKLAPRTSDGDFLRRVSLDLAGRIPSARELTLFNLDTGSDKRAKVIDRLLESDDYARNQARYWRDVVMTNATDQRARIVQRPFEAWLVEQFRKNRSWDAVASDLITATGDVREKGDVALIFAHNGDAKEIAAETSRIFLGIQIQCANCHDHPTDVWKREQFHQLAAYFPRVAVRPVFDQMRIRSFEVVTSEHGRRGGFDPINLIQRFDKNRDGKLTAEEVKGTRLERGFRFLVRQYDRDGDGAISRAEVEKGPRFGGSRRRRAGAEYFMPDLQNPSSRGRKMDPAFFVGTVKSDSGMKDLDRRKELAKLLTAKDNKWFSRAYVNRIWAEMLGEGFYMPIDDLGPTRKARFEEVLAVLSDGFTASGYDPKWLFRAIANTQAYQRQIRAKDASDVSPPFASASPTRLRADQIYDSLMLALGGDDVRGNGFGFGRRRRFGGGGAGMMRYGRFNERFRFAQLFSYDPSTPQADIVGTVPQALYLMNSPSINNLIQANGRTKLGSILRNNEDDAAALTEVYLMVLSREPSAKERKICGDYIQKVGSRTEAYEDILWSLVNSSEFLTKR